VKAVRFELRGKLAHFRRFYTNSSSLTYPLPPPPTIAGIIGAALGLSPSEYPTELVDVRYSVQPAEHWRTLFQTLNLLLVKEQGDLTGSKEHTQVPTQFLAPLDLNHHLSFKILAASESTPLVERIAEGLAAPVFPPFLGAAYCLGYFDRIELADGDAIPTFQGMVNGAMPRDLVQDIRPREGQRILRDRYPLRLDARRDLTASGDLLVEATGQPLDVSTREVLQIGGQEVYALL